MRSPDEVGKDVEKLAKAVAGQSRGDELLALVAEALVGIWKKLEDLDSKAGPSTTALPDESEREGGEG